jgi:kynurenine formamidase
MTTLHDLSQKLSPDMSVPPGLPQPRFEPLRRVPQFRSNVTHYSFSSHVGTHMDAPFHYFVERAHLDEIELDRFRGPGFVVPIRRHQLEQVTVDDIAPYREQLRDTSFVLLSSGWARHYGTAEYFNHPFLSEEVAQELVDLGVSCVILDVMTPDAALPVRPENHDGPVHRILLGNDVLIVENAASMTHLEGRQVNVLAFPVAIQQSDGAPVRLVVEADSDAGE